MMTAREYTRREKSLLLYFESVLVDGTHIQGASTPPGEFNPVQVNAEDIEIGHKLTDEKLILFRHPACVVRFTDEAWKLAHQFRRERAERHTETLTKEMIP